MHKRLFPKINSFTYNIYYVALPIETLHQKITLNGLKINKKSLLSFHSADHGNKTEKEPLSKWIKNIINQYGLQTKTKHVMLITMPRIMGYVFNPVSFWICFDHEKKIRAVISEVNNTFGETHSYLCAHHDHRPITSQDSICATKLFHVSPFLERDGHYIFRFDLNDHSKIKIQIDFHDKENNRQLVTSLYGTLKPMNKKNLRSVFWRHPLITLKTTYLIHWQAIKLIAKGIKHIKKPLQKELKSSPSDNLTKL